MSLLEPFGIPLRSAIEEYVAARSHLDGESLLSAVKEHAARRRHVIEKNVGEIVDEMLAAKKHDGLSSRYLYMLRSDLTRFKNSFQTNIGSISSRVIDDWLLAQNVTARTRNNLRAAVITLFILPSRVVIFPRDNRQKPTMCGAPKIAAARSEF